jgi:hypothetical protein
VSEKPSYLRAMLTSQANLYAGLSSMACGALLSLPFGLGIGLMPILLYVAGGAIASLYLPASITFRAKVDADHRMQQREKAQAHLLREIRQRTPYLAWENNESIPVELNRSRRESKNTTPTLYSNYRFAYQRMLERVYSLRMIAKDRKTQLSDPDVERLEGATLDFLCLWLGLLVIDDRDRAINVSDVEQKMLDIDEEIAGVSDNGQQRQLTHARAEYAALLSRHKAMLSKRHAMEAAMLGMPDQVEEIYQMIMAAPFSFSMNTKLEESLSRLRLEEELEYELNDDLQDATTVVPFREQQHTANAAAQKQPVSNSR